MTVLALISSSKNHYKNSLIVDDYSSGVSIQFPAGHVVNFTFTTNTPLSLMTVLLAVTFSSQLAMSSAETSPVPPP